MSLSVVIDPIMDLIKADTLLPDVIWENAEISNKDLQFLYKECNNDSEFDPTNKRKLMFNEMIKGNLYVVVSKCKYGQVMAVFESMEQMAELPWNLWGRILRIFSEPSREKFKVFFLASNNLRKFPHNSLQITAENINGGYTYRCNPETIVIYRAEDATRVLIHELQHSCCLDKQHHNIDTVEAETEAWAELVYTALLSQGDKNIFKDLLKKQVDWILNQNAKVKNHMKDPNSNEFPWRYTIGKENIWRRWGLIDKETIKNSKKNIDSLRLTHPPSSVIKDRFKVNRESTIL
jgi:hypothetical protein